MASFKHGIARLGEPLTSSCLRTATRPAILPSITPVEHVRWKSQNTKKATQSKKKKKESKEYRVNNLKNAQMWTLCDAMQ
jgi:hypothetical protein